MIVVAGIDPGLDGGVAVLEPMVSSGLGVESSLLPTYEGHNGRLIDTAALARWLTDRDVTDCAVEQVFPMGAQRALGYFMAYGAIIGLLRGMGINHHPVMPAKWQKHFGIYRGDKYAAIDIAIDLWPNTDQFARKKDVHRAEAALIAAYHRGDKL